MQKKVVQELAAIVQKSNHTAGRNHIKPSINLEGLGVVVIKPNVFQPLKMSSRLK